MIWKNVKKNMRYRHTNEFICKEAKNNYKKKLEEEKEEERKNKKRVNSFYFYM